MSEKEQELKPCPFCGGKVRLERYKYKPSNVYEEYIVRCDNIRPCPLPNSIIIKTQKGLDDVVQRWNSRPDQQGGGG